MTRPCQIGGRKVSFHHVSTKKRYFQVYSRNRSEAAAIAGTASHRCLQTKLVGGPRRGGYTYIAASEKSKSQVTSICGFNMVAVV